MKVYTDQEVEALIKEVQEQLVGPIIKAAQEQIAKNEKTMAAPVEGGNGTAPVAASMAKEESSMSESSSSSSIAKEESPAGKEASDEKSPAPAVPESSESSSSSSSSDAPAMAPEAAAPAPAPDAPAAAPEAAPAAAPEAMEDDHLNQDKLCEAYGALDDDALRAHFEALKQALSARMGAGQPDAVPAMAPEAAAPAPAEKAMPTMAPAAVKPAMPMMRSEAPAQAEDLHKAEVDALKKQVEGLTEVLERFLLKPQRKAVTTMAEFVAKSEADAPKKTLSKDEIRQKLTVASKDENLKKSDKDLIVRYFLQNDVKVEEIQHLLK